SGRCFGRRRQLTVPVFANHCEPLPTRLCLPSPSSPRSSGDFQPLSDRAYSSGRSVPVFHGVRGMSRAWSFFGKDVEGVPRIVAPALALLALHATPASGQSFRNPPAHFS